MPQVQPDDETKKRIKSLGEVGQALSEESNDNQGPTRVFVAKSSLKEFEEGINKLQLEPQSLNGMKFLIKFLEKSLDKKMAELS